MIYRLEQLATIKYGKNQKKVVSDKGSIPIYGTGGFMGTAVDYLYDKPTVLIGRKGSIEKVKYVEEPFWAVDTTFYTIINESLIRPHFLYYKLSLFNLKKYDEGTTIPSLRADTLKQIELDIPPLIVQDRVISIIESIEYKIENNIEINNNLAV